MSTVRDATKASRLFSQEGYDRYLSREARETGSTVSEVFQAHAEELHSHLEERITSATPPYNFMHAVISYTMLQYFENHEITEPLLEERIDVRNAVIELLWQYTFAPEINPEEVEVHT